MTRRIALAAAAALLVAACDSTEPVPPPDVPAPFTAVPNSNRQVTLSWGLSGEAAIDVRLERADPTGAFVPLVTLPGSARTHVDAGLEPGTAYQYRIQACNASGCSQPAGPVTATTFETLRVTTARLPGAVAGDSLRLRVETSGGSSPVTFTLASGSLPPGIALSPSGELSGTPTATGSFPITLVATSADAQTASAALVVLVRGRVVIVTSALPNALRGQSYTTGLNAIGGDSVYTWLVEAGSLPAGLEMSERGIISGTPTTEQVARFTARVRTGDGQTAVRDFSITVIPPVSAPALRIRTAQLPPALVNQSYQPQLFFMGGDGSAVTWSVVGGTLPPGVQLGSGGGISGRPTATGTFPITVRAANTSGQSVEKSFALVVVPDDTGRFDITRMDVSAVPADIAPHVAAAIGRWQTVITGDLARDDIPRGFFGAGSCGGFGESVNGTFADDVIIMVNIAPIDGAGKILGQASPCAIRFTILPVVGVLTLDAEDLSRIAGTQTLTDVIFHEIGHILGIGTLWDGFECPPSDGFTVCWDHLVGAGTSDPRFTGARAVQEWQALGGTGTVPVENEGGSGTRDSHWRETDLKNEMMTGFVSPVGTPNPLSRLTLASLADMGYAVNFGAADAFQLAPGAALRLGGGEPWERLDLGPILMKRPDGSSRPVPR